MNRRTVLKSAAGIGAVGIGGAALSGAGAADSHATTDYEVGDVNLSSDTGEIDYVAMHGESVFEWTGLDTTATHVEIETTATAYGINADGSADLLTYDTDGDGEAEPLEDYFLNATGPVALEQGAEWGNYDDTLSGEGTRGYVEHGVGLDENAEHDPSIEWVIVGEKPADATGSDYGLPEDTLPADAFTTDGDGETQEFDVVLETTYTLYNGTGEDADELLTESTAGTITVTVENIEASGDSTSGDGGATGGVTNDGETYE